MAETSAIMQVAFLVEGIHQAAHHWAENLGVGPFFVQEHVSYRSLLYRGERCAADISLAFAFSGDLQIELVCQHNDAPSVFRDSLQAHGYGAQHMGRICLDVASEVERYAQRGIAPLQHGISGDGIETVFLPFQEGPAGFIELIQGSESLMGIFAFMKATAANWDGRTAIYG